MINHSDHSQSSWNIGKLMTTAGWTHKLDFWVLTASKPGTMRIAVGEAYSPHRIMLNHDTRTQADWDGGLSMNTSGWTHKMEFLVFSSGGLKECASDLALALA